MKKSLIIGAVVIAAILIVGSSALFTIQETEQGIVLQFGDPKQVVTEPGLHFKVPFIQNVVIYDKRVLEFENPQQEVIASDQKRLVIDAFAFYRITNPLEFYQAVGTEEVARARLSNLLNASMRQLIGTVPLVDVISGERERLMEDIRIRINREAAQFGVVVIDVRIKRADLPEENSQAIYERMQTEREREAREIRAQGEEQSLRIRAEADRTRTVLISEARRQSEILRGEGDGEAVRIFADAFGQDVEFFTFYRTMQAYREALNADDTTIIMSPDGDFLQFLNSVQGMGGADYSLDSLGDTVSGSGTSGDTTAAQP
ncbi:MAG: protease modulator HflC [Pseudomonadota bacterium]